MTRANRKWSTNPKYPRTARVNEVLREVIADELERVDDPRLELVTVTGVDVDPDLRRAAVYFSALDTSAEIEEVGQALGEQRVSLQSVIGRSVRLKCTPQLRFLPDPAIEEGLKVEEILRNISYSDGYEGN